MFFGTWSSPWLQLVMEIYTLDLLLPDSSLSLQDFTVFSLHPCWSLLSLICWKWKALNRLHTTSWKVFKSSKRKIMQPLLWVVIFWEVEPLLKKLQTKKSKSNNSRRKSLLIWKGTSTLNNSTAHWILIKRNSWPRKPSKSSLISVNGISMVPWS